jgi:hypothetical protein
MRKPGSTGAYGQKKGHLAMTFFSVVWGGEMSNFLEDFERLRTALNG